MTRRPVIGLLAVGLLIGVSGSRAFGVGMDAQRIVVHRCAAALPPELAPFFEAHLADLAERVVEPDGVWRRERKMRSRRDWNHLWMDAKTTNRTMSARLAAAEAFPRDEAKARKLFKALGVRRGGKLPWAIVDLHADLVRAFEERDGDEIVRTAGHLAHFAWAASQPFEVSIDHDGRETGNLHLGKLDPGEPYYPHQSVHYRVAGELVRRYRNRYLERIQVRPIELQPISDPLEPCFHHMLGSLARLEDLLSADRAISERLGAEDGGSLLSRRDEFYELLDERCGEIVTDRLRAAALFSANLIAGAWERAGRPALADVVDASTATAGAEDREASRGKAPTPKERAGPAQIVGSRKSKVFHRADCAHVHRISGSNLVRYRSAEQARAQGKRPCKVCKPG